MTWWRGQNLEGPIRGPDGTLWNFLVWHGFVKDVYMQRIFFWNDGRMLTGLLELKQDNTLHVSKIRDRQRKIAQDAAYRAKWLQPLEFPIERYWPSS